MQQTGPSFLVKGAVAAGAAAVGFAVGLALVGLDVVPQRSDPEPAPAPSSDPGCPDGDRVALRVSAAPEIAPAIRDVAEMGVPAEEALRCVDITVSATPPATVRSALARGWAENVDGPPPHVWVARTTTEVELARATAAAQLLPDDPTHLARSPSVIAMPQPMADELDWPDGELTWNDVAKLAAADDVWAERDRPDWGPFRLNLVEDVASEPSITAVAALTRAVGALPDTDQQTDTSDAQQFEARAQLLLLERRIGYLGQDTSSQLDRLRSLDQGDELLAAVSALPLTEQMVWQYNGGPRDADPPPTPLAAWYPGDGGPDADYPYVQLDASWASSETDVAAGALLDALTSQDGIGRLRAHGFRDGARETTAELIEAAGLRPELAPPEPDRVPAQLVRPILQAWRGLSQTGNLLAVVDVSGSMATPVPGASATRLALSAQGLEAGIALTDPASSAGLWEFSTDLDGDTDHRILVPIGPLDEEIEPGVTRQEAQIAAIRDLEPVADTGLYDTIAASYEYVLDNYEPGKLNAVIFFTDGKNDDDDGLTLQALQQRLRELVDPEREVLFIGVAYGAEADFEALNAVTTITDGKLYALERPEDIRNVFIDVQTGGVG